MRILITGGAGFIGANLAAYFAKRDKVVIFDSLSRQGSRKNWQWLRGLASRNFEFVQGEIGDFVLVKKLVARADCVFHLAAQVAVTSSISNPREDFEVNLGGTFNVLEAARAAKKKPLIVFSSTNKVYGEIKGRKIVEEGSRYKDLNHQQGVSEEQPLDFYSPYGCSKGGADQYVCDYGRIFGLPTIVLRKSCIYGPRQFGTEDQGWVAHFVRQALSHKTIRIYGNGKQVRDLLYIDDLVKLYEKIFLFYQKKKLKKGGEVFNVGGGREKAVSLLELVGLLEGLLRRKIKLEFAKWRPGDQKVYISDISRVRELFSWEPKVGVREGVGKLVAWLAEEKNGNFV